MDKFNKVYIDFLSDLNKTFPNLNIKIRTDDIGRRYLYEYIENVLPYLEDISIKNVDFFKYKCPDLIIIKQLTFKNAFDNAKKQSKNNVDSILKYLQTLYILAHDTNELEKIIGKRYHADEKMLKILEIHDIIIQNIINSNNIHEEEEEKQNDKDDEDDEDDEGDEENEEPEEKNDGANPFAGTLIGDLAKELSEEIDSSQFGDLKNPADLFGALLGGGNAGGGLGQIMGTVCNKLDQKMKSGQIDQNKLFSEAQQLMGSLNLFGDGNGGGGGGMAQMMSSMMSQGAPPVGNHRARRKAKKTIKRKKKN